LFELARGIDDSSVTVDRPTQSISAEDTFGTDISLEETVPTILKLADRVWKESQEENRNPRTVVLKLKTKEFQQITRSHTPIHPPSTLDEFVEIANWLIAKVDLPDSTRYRLAGIGLSNFKDASLESFQPSLF
jgi:DNA polymerase-4